MRRFRRLAVLLLATVAMSSTASAGASANGTRPIDIRGGTVTVAELVRLSGQQVDGQPTASLFLVGDNTAKLIPTRESVRAVRAGNDVPGITRQVLTDRPSMADTLNDLAAGAFVGRSDPVMSARRTEVELGSIIIWIECDETNSCEVGVFENPVLESCYWLFFCWRW